jgi:hypothetical protein
MAMKVYQLQTPIYAENESEVVELRNAIVAFINEHRQHGRAVSARKVTEAIRNWDSNIIVKNRIINHFK